MASTRRASAARGDIAAMNSTPIPEQTPVETRPQQKAVEHPIPSMQQAFAESYLEATMNSGFEKPKLRSKDAKARREELLDQEESADAPAALWRLRPGQKCHELRKLMAQVSFGVYLLLNGLANSNAQVVSILQGHIDEIDEFLEVTMEDIDLALADLTERIDYLKLPMDNMTVFSTMLEDRAFRLQILEGNAKIEHILARTTTALMQSAQDLSEGLKSTKEFSAYLKSQEGGSWRSERKPDVVDIFEAMRGNTEGWLTAFVDLQTKTSEINTLVVQLDNTVSLIERTAGKVSRRTRFSVQPFTTPDQQQPARPPSAARPPSDTRPPSAARPLSDAQPPSESSESSTPPASPPRSRIPAAPPRLSLRFSGMSGEGSSGTYFDLPLSDSLFDPPVILEDAASQPSSAGFEFESELCSDFRHETPVHTNPRVSVVSMGRPDSPTKPETPPPESPGIRPPEPSSARPASPEGEPEVLLLQPRTYTPVPPSPLPSPLLPRTYTPTPSSPQHPPLLPRTYTPVPPSPQPSPLLPRTYTPVPPSPGPSLLPRTYTPVPPSPLPSPPKEQSKVAAVAPAKTVVATQVRTSLKHAKRLPVTKSMGDLRVPDRERARIPSVIRVEPRIVEINTSRSSETTARHSSHTSQSYESSSRGEQTTTKAKRTSLRQRVSLKTTPPESIQVPPPNAPGLQRPVFSSPRTYQAYQTFVAPDSAYGSDPDRKTASIRVERSGGSNEFAPPAFQGVIPSPHSDQQFFRPVQASPHSPLQQRPHTAGGLHPQYQAQRQNAPSAMGMSMLSSVSTMSPGSESGQTLKKKRSALGWLKKAFSLDEEERMAFEQRKNEQTRNPYYDARSPKYLDGKRLR